MSPLDRGSSSPEDPWVGIGFALAVGVIGLAFIVWGIGQLAGLAFRDGALSIGFGQMPGVLSRLPGTLSDPAAAWPAPDRGRLPGPVGFYAVAAAVVGCVVAAGLTAARLSQRGPWSSDAGRGE